MKRLAEWLMAGVLTVGCGGTMATTPRYEGQAYAEEGGGRHSRFHDELAPYGRWENHPRYGSVFVPARSGFEPYREGHWATGDDGNYVWMSDEPFGKVTEHYGRWAHDPRMGWVWIPGEQYGAGWVQWYQADNDVGWAPLGPDDRPSQDSYRFVPTERFGRDDMSRHYVSGQDWRDRARPIGSAPNRAWLEHQEQMRGRDGQQSDDVVQQMRERRDRERQQGQYAAEAAQRQRDAELAAQRQRDAELAAQRQRDAELAAQRQRDAELAAQRQREAEFQRDRDRDHRGGAIDERGVRAQFARQHAAEREALMRQQQELSNQEMAKLERRGASPSERQSLLRAQQERLQRETARLEQKQRLQIDEELRHQRASGRGHVR